MSKICLAIPAVLLLALSGCAQQQQSKLDTTSDVLSKVHVSYHRSSLPMATSAPPPIMLSAFEGESAANGDAPKVDESIWTAIEESLAFADDVPDDQLTKQINWLSGNQRYFDRTVGRAQLYLPYVFEKVREADMPSEVALLPFIESTYDPFAHSPRGASGLWQFIPKTAKSFGLEKNPWYEGRRDVVASTDAALSYIARLNKNFDGDWLLTFAAYNGGPGTVKRAIAKNHRAGKATDFWSLDLPDTTRRYVPRLIAVAKVLTEPERYDIDLMTMSAENRLKVVDLEGSIDLTAAAEITGVKLDKIYLLNPGLTSWMTPPSGPHHIVLPIDKADRFDEQLASTPHEQWQPKTDYIVVKGDTLGKIARSHHISVEQLARMNRLESNATLKIGQTILTPNTLAPLDRLPSVAKKDVHTVVSGDSLWLIAKKHGVSIAQLCRWNQLQPNTTLQLGQKIVLGSEAPQLTRLPVEYQQGGSLVR